MDSTESDTRPVEVLLVGAISTDSYSVSCVDPRTGVAVWSYKGGELQGAKTGLVHPLSNRGDHFVVAIQDRPLIHCLAFHQKDRFHAKAVVTGVVSALISTNDGTLLFAAIGTQILVWLMQTGELLCVLDAHYQPITHLAFSFDQSLLFSSSQDGAVHVYQVSDILSVDRDATTVTPLRQWRAHSLATTGMCVSGGASARVASCGRDHTATIHSVSLDTCLLKISAERPLTACALDPADTRLFLGTDTGNIAQVNLYHVAESGRRDVLLQTSNEHNTNMPVFKGHTSEINRLCVNGDGTLLASGDLSGKYSLWDIGSRQCLRTWTMRGPINSVRFIPNWETLHSIDKMAPPPRPNFALQKTPVVPAAIALTIQNKITAPTDREYADLIGTLLAQHQEPSTRNGAKTKKHTEEEENMDVNEENERAASENDSDSIAALKKEISQLKKVNKELYDFAAKAVLDNKGKGKKK